VPDAAAATAIELMKHFKIYYLITLFIIFIIFFINKSREVEIVKIDHSEDI